MNRNKIIPARNRDDNSMTGSSLWTSSRSIKALPTTSTSTGFRQSTLNNYTNTTKVTLNKKNTFHDDDEDDFVKQYSSRKHRKTNMDVNNSRTRSNYTPDPHDKSDFQNTHTTRDTLKKSNVGHMNKEFNRFNGRSLSNQKQSTCLSNAQRRPLGTSAQTLRPPNPLHSSATCITQPNALMLPIFSSTSNPTKKGISIPLGTPLDSRQDPPPLMVPSKRPTSLSISSRSSAASTQKDLMLPYRQKPLETLKPSQKNILRINNKHNHNEKLSELIIPGKRRTTSTAVGSGGPSTSTIATSSGFFLPGKHQIKKATDPSFTCLPDVEPTLDKMKDTVECPYCHVDLDLKQSYSVTAAYDDIKLKDSEYETQQLEEEQAEDYERDVPLGLSHAFSYDTRRRIRRPVSNTERYTFCQLHIAELVMKPKGRVFGWPEIIPFDTLSDRIHKIRKELDMVVTRRVRSTYRSIAMQAYNKMGKNKARSTAAVMIRFHGVLPGYYGTKGASIIQDILSNIYLYPGKLHERVTAPQTAIEYIQQVLVPEVGFRLIREDLLLKKRLEKNDPELNTKAKIVMAKSASYGSYLQPVDWNEDDDYEPSQFTVDQGQSDWNDALPGDDTQFEWNDDDVRQMENAWQDDDDYLCDDYGDDGSQTIYEWADDEDEEAILQKASESSEINLPNDNDDDDATVDEHEDATLEKSDDSNGINLQNDTTDDSEDNNSLNQRCSPADYRHKQSKDTVILLDDD